jgi:cytochrome c oxidase cbb3-type subunit 1
MDRPTKWFIKSALAWLALGVTLGVAMTLRPEWVVYRTAHLHMNLLGFVAGMIFGVGYHVLPRFVGHPLFAPRLAMAHWWLANAGLALLAGGFAWRVTVGERAQWMLIAGGALAAAGAYCFVFNIWRTIDGRSAAVATHEAMGRRGLTVVDRE